MLYAFIRYIYELNVSVCVCVFLSVYVWCNLIILFYPLPPCHLTHKTRLTIFLSLHKFPCDSKLTYFKYDINSFLRFPIFLLCHYFVCSILPITYVCSLNFWNVNFILFFNLNENFQF